MPSLAHAVSSALKESQCFLVLTVDARVPLSSELSAFLVKWNERPEPSFTLRRHLELHLDEDEMVALEDGYDLAPLRACLAERDVRDVERMAQVLVRAFREGRSQEQVLQEMGYGARARVEEWFTAAPTPEDVAFMLATTVLGGCTYTTVAGQARRLEGFIAGGSHNKPPRRPRLRCSLAVSASRTPWP